MQLPSRLGTGSAPFSNPNRRAFLRGSALVATSLGLMPGASLAATPQRGGHAIFGIGNASTADTFDPNVSPALMVSSIRTAIHDTLFEVAGDGSIVPSLAESWDVSADARTWRIKLKPGVLFHDGRSVTAADVVASVNLHLGAESGSPIAALMSHLSEVRADGEIVVFDLETPDADWPAILSEYFLSILPSSDGQADWASGIGCGAYRLLDFDPGVSARLERNEADHRSDRGWFETIEVLAINDSTARTSALLSGTVDVAARISPIVARHLEQSEGVNVISRVGPGYYVFQMHLGMSPTEDNNVRMALKYAIDRQEFVDKILAGYGSIANDNPIGATYKYFADLPQRAYDPDRAQFYLKQAGLADLSIDLYASEGAFEQAVQSVELYSEAAKKAGIAIRPNRVPSDGYWTDTWGKVPFFASYWGGRTTEAAILGVAYGSDSGWNATGFASPRLDEIVTQARGELDDGKRADLYREAQTIIRDTGPSIIPAHYQSIDAVSDRIGVPDISSGVWLDNRYALSRWWLA